MTDNDADAVRRSVEAVTAPRKFMFPDPDVERVLDITMALAAELAVTRERLDSLERLLEQKDVVRQDDVESFVADDEVSAERLADHDAMITRILRIVHQDVAKLKTDEKA